LTVIGTDSICLGMNLLGADTDVCPGLPEAATFSWGSDENSDFLIEIFVFDVFVASAVVFLTFPPSLEPSPVLSGRDFGGGGGARGFGDAFLTGILLPVNPTVGFFGVVGEFVGELTFLSFSAFLMVLMVSDEAVVLAV